VRAALALALACCCWGALDPASRGRLVVALLMSWCSKCGQARGRRGGQLAVHASSTGCPCGDRRASCTAAPTGGRDPAATARRLELGLQRPAEGGAWRVCRVGASSQTRGDRYRWRGLVSEVDQSARRRSHAKHDISFPV